MKRSGGGLKKLEMLMSSVAKQKLNVGWLEEAKYPNGTPVAAVMQRHIFGYGVPMRDPVRPKIKEKQPMLVKVFINELKKESTAPYDALGEQAAGVIRKGFKDITEPALAESTVKARLAKRKNKKGGSTIKKPLIDTALAVNSVSWDIDNAD